MALAALSVVICYADRSNISTAIIPMAQQYGWDPSRQGLVLSMFFLGYLGTQLLGGAPCLLLSLCAPAHAAARGCEERQARLHLGCRKL